MINIFTKKTIAVLVLAGLVLIIGLVSSAQKIFPKNPVVAPVTPTDQLSSAQNTVSSETNTQTTSQKIAQSCVTIGNNLAQILQEKNQLLSQESYLIVTSDNTDHSAYNILLNPNQQTDDPKLQSIEDQLAKLNLALGVCGYSSLASGGGKSNAVNQSSTSYQNSPYTFSSTPPIYNYSGQNTQPQINVLGGANSYTRVGDTTYGSDGTTYTQVGNTVYGNDGSTYTQVGNTIYGN